MLDLFCVAKVADRLDSLGAWRTTGLAQACRTLQNGAKVRHLHNCFLHMTNMLTQRRHRQGVGEERAATRISGSSQT